MASYATKVKGEIVRWTQDGLIDAATAQRLSKDMDLHASRGFGIGAILAMLAALLLGAAILIVIAANWEEVPRIARVGLVFAVIFSGYVGGALLELRDQPGAAQALYMIAAAAFGGAIALIGQMYHLSGDERDAVLVWGAGVAGAAALLRSGPLTAAAVALAGVWLWLDVWDFWRDQPMPGAYLPMLAGLWALSLWTRSSAARHLILLSLIGYAVILYLRSDLLAVPIVLAAVSAGLFLAASQATDAADRVLQLDGGGAYHGLIGFAAGTLLVQAALVDEGGFMVASLAAFAGSIAALTLGGRDSRGLRWLAYLFFAVELCFVYVAMVGTMLGTAGFLLAAGLLLAVMAVVITRFERRVRRVPAGGAA